ncbi:MAG: prenyltransferase, partial [Duncaniella sp.]|nr:prenyltransferase [Duncaniella sp.]
ANVLIVNNYRDADDDRAVGKKTLAVRFGRKFVSRLYLVNGFAAVILTFRLWLALPTTTWIVPIAYLVAHTILYRALITREGRALNPLLGMTALLMLAYSIGYLMA